MMETRGGSHEPRNADGLQELGKASKWILPIASRRRLDFSLVKLICDFWLLEL